MSCTYSDYDGLQPRVRADYGFSFEESLASEVNAASLGDDDS